MAQLLVHIDAELKRKLKVKLAEEGTTFKMWVEQMAMEYLGTYVVKPRPTKPTSPPVQSVHPQTGFTSSDYNLEED